VNYDNNDRTTVEAFSNDLEEENKVWSILEQVCDPEVPVLSIVDLGIVREVSLYDTTKPGCDASTSSLTPPVPDRGVAITITPTYSGCPAMDVISMSIRMALLQNGFKEIKINTVLSPAWTTDWMTEAGKQKLKAYGIAPPNPKQTVCSPDAFQQEEAIQCPQCNSFHTHLVSRFGSTACKALYQCDDCKEPFDYFKCH
jgi:ring-1,2-phenylacetyl-CoA epoxidase subunit PaaD